MFNSYPNIIQKWNWAAGNLKYLDSKKMGAVVKIYYFPFYIALGLQHSACFSCENISWRRWELQLQISILTFSPLSSALLDLKHQVLIVHVQSPNWIFKSVSDDIRALLSEALFVSEDTLSSLHLVKELWHISQISPNQDIPESRIYFPMAIL